MNESSKAENWVTFYDGLNLEDHLYNLSRHRYLISKIVEKKPDLTVEVGCGSGIMSIFLSYLGIEVVVVDIHPGVVKLAIDNTKKFNASLHFILTDALSPLPIRRGIVDIAFSQGVAEHFNNDEIVSFVKNQLNFTDCVILAVPSKYSYGWFGDERMLTDREWRNILKIFSIKDICYYGIELPPSWDYVIKKILTLRPHHIIRPHHIFIEIGKSNPSKD